ncbi:Gfo/Idh/MocA family protein [Anaerovibrio lipolyticus]|uniref:Gfo/Idh/MocA family protein n=1 Tax=Anaerovibrio lipolyticus TaxID=82374 RepID=UPI000686A988|nr:Gfo/Idh/MocA family oxidoreductase [Anaerovibrio lipolyticus]
MLPIGVIGVGHMGRNHVRNLNEEKCFDLVGIYDSNYDAAMKVGQKYDVHVCRSIEELLESVEAVVIAVPSSLHKEIGLMAAHHGVHALIEKPLATNAEDAKFLSEVFKEKGLVLSVGHIERCNPVFVELQKLVKPSDIFYVEACRYSPFVNSGRISDTSVVEDLMIHDIDLVCELMNGVPVKSVQGYGEIIQSKQPDFATCVLQFNANAHAVIHASRVSQDKVRTLEVHTKDFCIYADLIAKTLSVSKNTHLVVDQNRDNSYMQDSIIQKIYVPIQEPLRAELIMFYNAVRNGSPVLVDGFAGTRAIDCCEKVIRQINDNI